MPTLRYTMIDSAWMQLCRVDVCVRERRGERKRERERERERPGIKVVLSFVGTWDGFWDSGRRAEPVWMSGNGTELTSEASHKYAWQAQGLQRKKDYCIKFSKEC